MPEVDGKKFPYTKKGMKAAKEEAKKSGKKMKTKKYMAGGMAGGAAPMAAAGAPAMPMSEEEKKRKMMEAMKAKAGGMGGGAPAPKMPAMKRGGKVKGYKSGRKVRGAGIAKQGVRKCKMR